MSIFKRKNAISAEERCNGCCCNCPSSAPKCNKGRAAFGLPLIKEDTNEKDA